MIDVWSHNFLTVHRIGKKTTFLKLLEHSKYCELKKIKKFHVLIFDIIGVIDVWTHNFLTVHRIVSKPQEASLLHDYLSNELRMSKI